MTSLSPLVAGRAGELPTALLPCPHHGEFPGFDRPPLTTDTKLICQMPCASSSLSTQHPPSHKLHCLPALCQKQWPGTCGVTPSPRIPVQRVSGAAFPSTALASLTASSDGAPGPKSHHGWCVLIGAVLSAHSPQHSKSLQMLFPTPQEQINHPLLL